MFSEVKLAVDSIKITALGTLFRFTNSPRQTYWREPTVMHEEHAHSTKGDCVLASPLSRHVKHIVTVKMQIIEQQIDTCDMTMMARNSSFTTHEISLLLSNKY